MAGDLYSLNDIFYNKYRPWLMDYSDQRYEYEIMMLGEVYYLESPYFVVEFPKPLNFKRKFFKKLVENECYAFLKQLRTQVQDDNAPSQNEYYVFIALHTDLCGKLHDVAETILQRGYAPWQYERDHVYMPCLDKNADNAYVLYFVKHMLVCMYMEVQQRYALYLKDEPLTEDEIYLTFFDHSLTGHIIPRAVNQEDAELMADPAARPAYRFSPCTKDLLPARAGVLPYEKIISKPSLFANVEKQLFNYGFISHQYQYQEKRGNKKELALIVIYLKSKGYFNKREFPCNKPITIVEISKFFEQRYGLLIEREIRRFMTDQQGINDLLQKYYWLDTLLS